MGPPFIDGGSNPFGNKGADLIETIRLEGHRDGPGIYLGSAGVRGIAKPHPCVDTATNLPLRKRPDAGRKPWAERRPNSAAATVRVHNAEAVQRMLHGGGTSDAGGSQPASQQASEIVRSGASPVASHVESRASRASASGSRAASKSWPARPQSAAAALGAVGRQALLEKQRLNQERVMQRLREKQAADAARQDREYAERQARIRSGEAGIVSDVGTFLSLKAEDAQRKKEKLHAEWTEEIFAPIQAQIDREVVRRARTAEGLGARWRAVQDQYLETSERKEFGLFRDIIIESEYDPLVNHARSVRYRRAHLKDPVKLELNKFEEERRAIPGETYAKQQLCKETLTPLLWDKLDATPYGRFSKMMAVSSGAQSDEKSALLASKIPMDHYGFPTGRAAIDREFPKPKRTFHNVVKR